LLASITPLGERGRNSRFGVTYAAYATGCLIGGGALGLVLGAAGVAIHSNAIPYRLDIWVAIAVLGAAADLRLIRGLRVPTHRRQVPERWLYTYRGWVYGLGFGVQLGAAFVTIMNSSLVYIMAAAAVLSGTLRDALVIGLAFGSARALALLPAARIRTTNQLMRMTHSLYTLDNRARHVTVGASLTLALVIVASSH
jgi:MFS family permease